MQNLKQGRKGFTYEVKTRDIPADPAKYQKAKTEVVRFEVSYLNGSRHKGVNIFLRTVEIEQAEGGFTFESFALMGNGTISTWGRILPRKNDKAVAKFAEEIDPYVADIVAKFIVDPNEAAAALRAVVAELNREVAQ